MNSGQGLYWAISLPVTFGVVVLAFLYGYKRDTLTGNVKRRLGRRRGAGPKRASEKRGERLETRPTLRTGTDLVVVGRDGGEPVPREEPQVVFWQNTVEGLLTKQKPRRRATSQTIGV